jgi:hypothetical protein
MKIRELASNKMFNVPTRMWNIFLAEAKKQKADAEKRMSKANWREGPSGIAIQAWEEYARLSIDEIAKQAIQYLHYRAHQRNNTYLGGAKHDIEYRQWIELGGKRPF